MTLKLIDWSSQFLCQDSNWTPKQPILMKPATTQECVQPSISQGSGCRRKLFSKVNITMWSSIAITFVQTLSIVINESQIDTQDQI